MNKITATTPETVRAARKHDSPAVASAAGTLQEVLLARPRGFCAGVDRAIAIVERALECFGAPIYVKHAIVHNRHVVERLERLGVIFVEELRDVPRGARVIFSAHGVPPQAHTEAAERELQILDATCPLVTKVHMEARHYARSNKTIFLIGHAEHVEVIGTRGEAPEQTIVVSTEEEARRVQVQDPHQVAYLTQTTLSVDEVRGIARVLQERFPQLSSPRKEDICYATQNRQQAVRMLALHADRIFVIGSKNSSNSNRLVEVACSLGIPTQRVEAKEEIDPQWLEGIRTVGVTAGASAPEDIVQDLVAHLARHYGAQVRELHVVDEHVTFPMPSALKESMPKRSIGTV